MAQTVIHLALVALASACIATPTTAQDKRTDAAIERLHDPGQRTRAMAELARGGPAATEAVARALGEAGGARAEVLASALADLPPTERAVPRILAAMATATTQARDALMHALGNCVLTVSEPDTLASIDRALEKWIAAGWVYTADPREPTFAWYEYVRLRRRIALVRAGTDAASLSRMLARIMAERNGIDSSPGVHDLNRFGRHGTRESLEAIAELTLQIDAPRAARALTTELAAYLAHERPRPAITLTEHCAGIGENAPDANPAVKNPSLWRRDDWRFACARAVFAAPPDRESRELALRHLLYAPSTRERLEALIAVRSWNKPWTALLPDVAEALSAEDRAIVREALITLGLADGIDPAKPALRRLAAGKDRELAILARRLLE